jgi:hypothetical protein
MAVDVGALLQESLFCLSQLLRIESMEKLRDIIACLPKCSDGFGEIESLE